MTEKEEKIKRERKGTTTQYVKKVKIWKWSPEILRGRGWDRAMVETCSRKHITRRQIFKSLAFGNFSNTEHQKKKKKNLTTKIG